MKISTQLRYDVPPAEVAKQAVDLEAAGLDLIWVAEAYGVRRREPSWATWPQ